MKVLACCFILFFSSYLSANIYLVKQQNGQTAVLYRNESPGAGAQAHNPSWYMYSKDGGKVSVYSIQSIAINGNAVVISTYYTHKTNTFEIIKIGSKDNLEEFKGSVTNEFGILTPGADVFPLEIESFQSY